MPERRTTDSPHRAEDRFAARPEEPHHGAQFVVERLGKFPTLLEQPLGPVAQMSNSLDVTNTLVRRCTVWVESPRGAVIGRVPGGPAPLRGASGEEPSDRPKVGIPGSRPA